MSSDQENSQNLSVRCPACRQRFTVDAGLMGRMVECGNCDARFRIDDEVIIRSKKFYHGERKDAPLNRFQRVPLATSAPEEFQTARYAEFNHPEQLEPTSPQRLIAGFVGVAIMGVIAILLVFSSNPGSALSGMAFQSKLFLAGFFSLLGCILLVYGNPRSRKKAACVALIFGLGVMSIPFSIKSTAESLPKKPRSKTLSASAISAKNADEVLVKLKEKFGTNPLEAEQTRLTAKGDDLKAYGIYITNLIQRNKYTARDFLIRESEADVSSHLYPRDDGDYLLVLSEVAGSFEQVSKTAAMLGAITESHPELGIVVIRADNEQFVSGSAEKLNNKDDPAFYQLNMRELASLDLDRVKRSVERISVVEPKIYQNDINKILVALMLKPGVRFHDEIARAQLIWADKPGPAGKAALEITKKYLAEGRGVPESIIDLIAKENPPGAAKVIHSMWVANPNLWQSRYLKLNGISEADILAQLDSEEMPILRSALEILAQVGTQKSLPELRLLTQSREPGIRVLAERAVAEIQGR